MRGTGIRVMRQALSLFLVIVGFGTHCRVLAQKETPDYSLGRPRLWIYQRVYPFLDGIFQDVASTQVASLTLNPNNANAGQLDALLTSWAAGVSFSATQGAQNALAQQQNQLSIANTQLQSQLLSQQQQLTQQLLVATQKQGQAQAAVDQLKAQTNPDPTQLAEAQGQLAVATDNVNSLTSQLNLVKAQVPTSAPTFSQPNPSQPTSATLPTQLSSLTAPPGTPTNPNFPVSKQMDNQVNLLWERLSRLVSTIAQADNLNDYNLVLAAFDVNLMPNREDKRIFAVEYQATTESCGSPLAVDLFPSASAVNIVNNRYKDSRGAIGVVLSWFSWGLNAAYNRDHLQITQALGQSAYITGFGAGESKFGWAFGRNLGDKSISPGKRTVFAIIAVPNSCKALTISSMRAGWFGEKSDDWYSKNSRVEKKFVIQQPVTINESVGFHQNDPVISSVAYTPVEFDSTATTPAVTALRINLKTEIDPQMTVSLNGQVIPRARDTFARAVQNAGGSGGLLESTSYTVNTWIPTSSWTVTISLDASKFEKRFPDVVLTTAQGITPLSKVLPRVKADGSRLHQDLEYVIAGDKFVCQDPCDVNMPPLGYRKATWQPLSAFRRPADAKSLAFPDVVLSLASDTGGNTVGNSGTSNVQVLAPGPSPWGGNAVVLMEFQQGNDLGMLRLQCSPLQGTVRLGCRVPTAMQSVMDQILSFEVHDPDHSGGAVSARAVLNERPKPPNREGFIVWSISQPRWLTKPDDPNGPQLLLCATFMLPDNSPGTFTLGFANGTPMVGNEFKFVKSESACHGDSGLWTGGVRLSLDDYVKLSDQLTILRDGTNDPPATLLNVHSAAEPVVTVASSDYMQLYGQNLVFGDHIQIDSGPLFPLACDSGGTSCQINAPKPVPQKPPTPAPQKPAPPPSPTNSSTHGSAQQPPPAPPAKPKPAGNKPAAGATPKNALGDKGGPVYIVYTKNKHAITIPIMKNTNGTVAAFQYVPPSVTQTAQNATPQAPAVASVPANANSGPSVSPKSTLVVQ